MGLRAHTGVSGGVSSGVLEKSNHLVVKESEFGRVRSSRDESEGEKGGHRGIGPVETGDRCWLGWFLPDARVSDCISLRSHMGQMPLGGACEARLTSAQPIEQATLWFGVCHMDVPAPLHALVWCTYLVAIAVVEDSYVDI